MKLSGPPITRETGGSVQCTQAAPEISNEQFAIGGTLPIMACKKCSSENLKTFDGEIALHFPGLEGQSSALSVESLAFLSFAL